MAVITAIFCFVFPQPEVSDGHSVAPVPGAPDANDVDAGADGTDSPTGTAAYSSGTDGAAYAISVVNTFPMKYDIALVHVSRETVHVKTIRTL